jgi:hypothetical protein
LLDVGSDLLVDDARLVAASAGTSYWVLPMRDGQGVCFFGADEEGGAPAAPRRSRTFGVAAQR